jgi:predicted ArsR family transcriptional regulator
MSEPDTAPAPRTIDSLLAGRVSIRQLASELNICERTARAEMDRLQVSFVKLCNVRWYDRSAIRQALLARTVTKTPRGRGRPRTQQTAQ